MWRLRKTPITAWCTMNYPRFDNRLNNLPKHERRSEIKVLVQRKAHYLPVKNNKRRSFVYRSKLNRKSRPERTQNESFTLSPSSSNCPWWTIVLVSNKFRFCFRHWCFEYILFSLLYRCRKLSTILRMWRTGVPLVLLERMLDRIELYESINAGQE